MTELPNQLGIENSDSGAGTRDHATISSDLKPRAPGVLDALAMLPDKTLLTENALASALGVSKRTVRRMVARFELPPAVRFGGRSCWQSGAVLRWFEARADRAARQAGRAASKFEN